MVFCPIRPVKPPRVSKTGLNDAVLLNFIGVPIRIENRPGSGTEQAPPPLYVVCMSSTLPVYATFLC